MVVGFELVKLVPPFSERDIQKFPVARVAEMQTLANGARSTRLSAKESELLRLLCLHRNGILTREEALLKIWHDDSYFAGRSMDVYVTKLRKLLRMDKSVEIITIHGRGYKLVGGG